MPIHKIINVYQNKTKSRVKRMLSRVTCVLRRVLIFLSIDSSCFVLKVSEQTMNIYHVMYQWLVFGPYNLKIRILFSFYINSTNFTFG